MDLKRTALWHSPVNIVIFTTPSRLTVKTTAPASFFSDSRPAFRTCGFKIDIHSGDTGYLVIVEIAGKILILNAAV